MSVPRRTIGFIVFAIAVSLACLRLGVWQLARLKERRAYNAGIAARLLAPVAPFSSLGGLPDSLRYRRTVLTGRFDYSQELLLAGRARGGSPGVFLLTPMRQSSTDTAVLVLRGWVYAPDGKTIDLSQWHEGDSVTVSGFVQTYTKATGTVTVPSAPRGLRFDDRDSLASRLPYPIAEVLVTQTSDSAQRQDHPARLKLPALDDGPHQSYAIQWFSFALIAWIGIGAVLRKARTSS
ncbi:MAG: SURF1 family protein [Gemmatimonadaceae bacterium]